MARLRPVQTPIDQVMAEAPPRAPRRLLTDMPPRRRAVIEAEWDAQDRVRREWLADRGVSALADLRWRARHLHRPVCG